MITEQQAFDIITQHFPDPIKEHQVIQLGWANLVFEINREWIFRFSRDPSDAKQLQIEKVFLPAFEKASPLPVPHIEYQGENWIGYRMIQGQPFTAEVRASLSSTEQALVFEQVGSFLSALHTHPFHHPDLAEFPFGGSDFWEDLWPIMDPHLKPATREKAKAYFETNLSLLENTPRVICHSDLGTNHLLYDAQQKKLNGIIDFGDLRLYDPASDFNGMLRHHGEEGIEMILKHYNGPIDTSFRKRIEIYSKQWMFEVGHAASTFEKESEVPSIAAEIERLFEEE